jgi:hypothetical protein
VQQDVRIRSLSFSFGRASWDAPAMAQHGGSMPNTAELT